MTFCNTIVLKIEETFSSLCSLFDPSEILKIHIYGLQTVGAGSCIRGPAVASRKNKYIEELPSNPAKVQSCQPDPAGPDVICFQQVGLPEACPVEGLDEGLG